MKKPLLLGLCLFVSIASVFAQRTLEVREKTEALSIFVDKDTEIDQAGGAQAGAIISCPTTLNLTFTSNVDRTVDVFKTEERGDVRFYYLRLIVGRYRGASYANRVLEVAAAGFAPLRFSLELQPSESKSYEVFDPNATVGVGCFYQHFNEGVELFKKALYTEAREKYRLSMECTDMPADADMAGKIRDIDSIMVLRAEGDKYFNEQLYKEAAENFQKVIAYNINDEYAQARAKEAETNFATNCRTYYNGAEIHYTNGDYADAKKLYELVVLMSCPRATEAGLRLADIKKLEADQFNPVTAILYEYQDGAPIGLSVGAYKAKKFSGYASFRFSPSVFAAMQKDYEKSERSEINFSVGWTTMKLQIPVWGFFGVGYTGVSSWDWEELNDDGDPAFKMHSAISPEIGVLGKLGPVALRYTFQYRFPFDKDWQDYIGQVRHVFGIGICF